MSVDLTTIFIKLKGLVSPGSIGKGKLGIYLELKKIVKIFEDDKDFKKILAERKKKKKAKKKKAKK